MIIGTKQISKREKKNKKKLGRLLFQGEKIKKN